MHLFDEYYKNSNLLTRVDVRIKLILTFSLLIMVLCSNGITFPLFVAVLSIVLCRIIDIPSRVMLIRFSEPLFIAAMLLFLKFFFTGHEPLFCVSIAGIDIIGYKDGLMEGIRLSSRIIGAVSLIALAGFSSPFTDIITGLSWFKIPSLFLELLMITYRYIFVLFEDAGVIYNAQKNRLGYSSIRLGLSSFGTLSGELIIRAFDRSQITTQAMFQRGYTGNMPVGHSASFKINEVAIALVIIVAAGVLWKIM
ncbi:MAG: cobalt ECF transporter T component CbiQ [Proteobacteria bacterium]|nr:cobalt ECF transporter T component CbiQ [Pseudomonadota bacterium]